MNRVQTAFIGVFAVILAADLAVSLALSAAQGSGWVAAARWVFGATAILLFAGGLLLVGSTPTATARGGLQNSPLFVTPNFGRVLRQDRALQARGVSDYPVVGVLYGLFLMVVTFFLYLLPG